MSVTKYKKRHGVRFHVKHCKVVRKEAKKMKKIKEENKTVELVKNDLAVIVCTDGRICDDIHIHGGEDLKVKLLISKVFYDDDSYRSYVYLYINGIYTATFYGYELKNIVK